MLYQITAPANNERGPRYIEKALAAIHQAHPSQPVSLLYSVREGQIGLFVRCDDADRDAVIEPMVAGYPEASVTLVEEWGTPQRGADVSLSSPITVNGQQDDGHSNTTRKVPVSKEQFLYNETKPVFDLIEEASQRSGVSRGQAFEDFLHMSVCAMSGGTMEDQYLAVVERHKHGKPGRRGCDSIARAFGTLVASMEQTQGEMIDTRALLSLLTSLVQARQTTRQIVHMRDVIPAHLLKCRRQGGCAR